MKTIKWYIETDRHGSRQEGTFEVEDDTPEDEIELQAKEEAFNHLSWGYVTAD